MLGGVSVLGGAVSWGADLMAGPLATCAAVLAVAWFGMVMMQGRIEWRSGVRIIMGCFILFGAPAIAKGVIDAALGRYAQPMAATAVQPAPTMTAAPAPQFDPYAGAALPR